MENLLPIDPYAFARQMISEVEASTGDPSLSRITGEYTRWTKAVKGWLATKAAEYDCRAIYTDCEGMSEFMLDFVWWKKGKLGTAVLACESEWGNLRDPGHNAGRVAEDFDKLLSFKSPFKLMIFDSYNDAILRKEAIAELNRYLQEFGDHRIGEQYLVIDMCPLPSAWVCRIELEGYSPALVLDAIPI